MREERRIVTALFADVVNSTGLAERLDGEEARLVLGETISRVIAAIERYGGTIKDLAGDGVFALFGAPTAHEDDGERALHAALEIIDVGAEKARELEQGWGFEGFAMRVGVHTGEVVLGPVGAGSRIEYGAVGDPINTASRLEAEAAPGTILVSEATRHLAETRFRWSDPMELTLRGKSEPVGARRLLGPGSSTATTSVASSPLAGRQEELGTGREALEALGRGQGSVLFVSGDPGIGKSRLIAELRALAVAAGTPWHEGRCVSYGESMPYFPYRDLLRDIFGLGPRDPQIRLRIALQRQLTEIFGDRQREVAPYLSSLLGAALDPEDAANLDQLSPESRQFRTFEVVGDLVARLAGRGPMVLVLEDVHWADPSSIQLTERLLAIVENLPVLLIISHRSERDHPSWTLRETAAREYPHIHRALSLHPLEPEEQESLLLSLAEEGGLPDTARAAVLRYAEGNPFFVEQLVRSLSEGRALGRAPAVLLEVPPTIEELILARVDRLPEATRQVLTAATPLGHSFGVSLLEAVSSATPDEVRIALHELRRSDLLHEERRWPEPEHRFTHALIQDTLYRTLLGAQRRALHARAASWLEARHADHLDDVYSLLAYHWRAAEDTERAIHFLELAGDRAREQWALDEAITHYRDLVDLLGASGRHAEAASTLFKLGLALHTAMRYGEADAVWKRAFETRPETPPIRTETTATLRIASFPIPLSADPHTTIRWSDIQLGMELNDRLVEARPNFNLVPGLAESWEVSEDGLRYTFRLRADAAWNDGRRLQASEIETAIRRQLDPDQPGAGASIYFCLENASGYFHRAHDDPSRIGVRALDERTLEFRLEAPAPYFMNVLNRPDANAAGTGAAGSGPFELVELTDEVIRLRRSAAHRRIGPGNVDEVEWVAVAPAVAAAAFAGDEFDLLMVRYGPVPPELDAAEVRSRLLPSTTSVFMAFDCAGGPGADLHLRRALALAIDRGRLAGLPGVRGVIATGGLVPPALPGHTPDIALRFDPDEARKEFAASAGPALIRVGTLESWEEIAREVVSMWSEVLGAEFRLEYHEHATAAFEEGCVAMVYNWLPGYPDADYYLRLLLHSQSRNNFAGWKSDAFDHLIEESRLKTSAAARLALFHEADRLAVQDECPVIPLLYYRPLVLAKPWVTGYWEWGKAAASFGDLVIEPGSPRLRSAYDTPADDVGTAAWGTTGSGSPA